MVEIDDRDLPSIICLSEEVIYLYGFTIVHIPPIHYFAAEKTAISL
jgi:hypothetical protein